MAHKITTDQFNGYEIDSSNQKWVLEPGVKVSNNVDFAFVESVLSTGNTIVLAGQITNPSNVAVGLEGSNTRLTIAAGGFLDGAFGGLSSDGAGQQITNDGIVHGGSQGVYFSGKDFHFDNNATVSSGDYAVEVHEAGHGQLVNSKGAQMSGGISGIFLETHGSQKTAIVNDGTITGGNFSIYSGGASEHVTNHGLLYGDVSLGRGNDILDGRGGAIAGMIDLGGGDDRIDLREQSAYPADGNGLTIFGGKGNDTYLIDSSDVHVIEAKNGGTQDQVRSATSYTLGAFVEKLQLIGSADLNGKGSDGYNVLEGNSGNNHLNGMAGGDDLDGGRGNDVLTGGADSDLFIFTQHGGHDRVTDFSSGVDAIDLTDFGVADFATLKQDHMHDGKAGLMITFGADHLLLQGVHIGDVAAGDFHL